MSKKEIILDNLVFKSRKDYNYYLKLANLKENGLIKSFCEEPFISRRLDFECTTEIENENKEEEIKTKQTEAVRSKYNANKVTINEITFDSQLEADYYLYLLEKLKNNQIKGFRLQPSFELLPSFKKNGKTHRNITYKADFEIEHLDGKLEIVDTKGMITPDFSIKRKLFEYKYDLKLSIVKYVVSMGGWIEYDEWKKISTQRKKLRKKK